MRTWTLGAGATALLAATLVSDCRYEDRRLAPVAVAHSNMLALTAALHCHKERTGGYPRQLAELAESSDGCPTVPWLAEQRPKYPQPHYAFYDYLYSPAGQDQAGRFQRFGLLASGPKTVQECDVCRSFWLDDSGVLREAPGRSAGPTDEPVKE
jgi:hypothetical protein